MDSLDDHCETVTEGQWDAGDTLGSTEDITYHPSPVSSEASSMSSEASCPSEENDWEDNLEEVMDLGENKDDASDQEELEFFFCVSLFRFVLV